MKKDKAKIEIDIYQMKMDDLAVLQSIINDSETKPAVKNQAIQTKQKILDSLAPSNNQAAMTAADIMNKVRGQ